MVKLLSVGFSAFKIFAKIAMQYLNINAKAKVIKFKSKHWQLFEESLPTQNIV